jgi:hypothetical protein
MSYGLFRRGRRVLMVVAQVHRMLGCVERHGHEVCR